MLKIKFTYTYHFPLGLLCLDPNKFMDMYLNSKSRSLGNACNSVNLKCQIPSQAFMTLLNMCLTLALSLENDVLLQKFQN